MKKIRTAIVAAFCLIVPACASTGARPTPNMTGYDSQTFNASYDAVYQACLYAIKAQEFTVNTTDEPPGVIHGRIERGAVLSDEHDRPMFSAFPAPGRDALLPAAYIVDLRCKVEELGPGVVEVDLEIIKNQDRVTDLRKYEMLFKAIADRLAKQKDVR